MKPEETHDALWGQRVAESCLAGFMTGVRLASGEEVAEDDGDMPDMTGVAEIIARCSIIATEPLLLILGLEGQTLDEVDNEI